MSDNWLGRIDKIVLLEDDNIEVRDVSGLRIKMAPNGARALHRELGKFLSMENDGKPLTVPTRADFRNLQARVEALEKRDTPFTVTPTPPTTIGPTIHTAGETVQIPPVSA